MPDDPTDPEMDSVADKIERLVDECHEHAVDWRARCLRAEDTLALRKAHEDLRSAISAALADESLPERARSVLRDGVTAVTLLAGVVPSTQLLLEDLLRADHDGTIALGQDWIRRIYNQLTVLGMTP